MSNDSKTKDPRVEAGAKAWDKHMGDRYAPNEVEELSEEVAVILAAADAVDPVRIDADAEQTAAEWTAMVKLARRRDELAHHLGYGQDYDEIDPTSPFIHAINRIIELEDAAEATR